MFFLYIASIIIGLATWADNPIISGGLVAFAGLLISFWFKRCFEIVTGNQHKIWRKLHE